MVSFFKVVVLGDGGIGKTSICNYLTTGEFFGSYKLSIGADFFSKKLDIDGEEVTLQICDIGGQDQFAEISDIFTKGAHGAILCYDTTRRETLDSLERWIDKLDDKTVPKVLVSTKNDVEKLREVWDEEGLKVAQKLDIPYYIPTTSLKGIGIIETFEAISRLMLMAKLGTSFPIESVMIDVSSPPQPEVRAVSGSQHITAQPVGLGRVSTDSEEPQPYQPPIAPTTDELVTAPLTPKMTLIQPTTTTTTTTTTSDEEILEEESIVPPVVGSEELAAAAEGEEELVAAAAAEGEEELVAAAAAEGEEELVAEEVTPVPAPPLSSIEPPTIPEKTAIQPINSIAPLISEQESSKTTEPSKEIQIKQSRFSFLDRLRKERKRYELQKREEEEETEE